MNRGNPAPSVVLQTPFTTTTDSFRLSYQTTADSPDAPFLANVESADPSQSIGPTGSISRNGSASGETFANAPPARSS
jgi:hypothetical protein